MEKSQPEQKTYLDRRFRFSLLYRHLLIRCCVLGINVDAGAGLFCKFFRGKGPLPDYQQQSLEQFWRDIGGKVSPNGYWTVD